jgi:thiamine pyrophosphate-dependent acetolactate synthase large subunit-like protein
VSAQGGVERREIRVGDAIADAVAAEGVTAAFGLLGEGNIAVVERFAEQKHVEWFAARREDAAVSMADGYARRAGAAVGFATVTHGPGVTNALTALTEARKAATPLVVLAGDTAREDFTHPQAIEERAFVEATGAGVHTVRSAATAVEDVAIAFGRARRESRPIVLVLASDLADEPYSGPPLRVQPRRRGERSTQRMLPDERTISSVAEHVRSAKRPVVLAGRGAVASGARDALVALADEIGGMLATTLLARGFFRGHPCNVGVAGGFGEELANDLLLGADLVLAFGTSLSEHTSKGGSLLRQASVVRFDLDPTASSSTEAGEQLVLGDARASADALLACIRDEDRSAIGYRTPELLDAIAAHRPGAGLSDESGPEGLDPRTLALALDAMLPAGCTVVVDLGYFTAEACKYVQVDEPNKFVFPINFGSIGLALATAAGASVADRSGRTVAIVGDGGLMMAVAELETLRRYNLPVVVVVFNDSAYGIEYHALRLRQTELRLSLFDDVDFAAVARGFGIHATTVRTTEELRGLSATFGATTGPVLIDAKVNRKVETQWLTELVAAGWHQHGRT